ncbi:hypothetical protein PYCCODRAFT_1421618 [Trametes coccinea BRFM310]|uniref:DUF6534 domain-containing protein n=1 Tax=Trametes coccinea (strain BRFM310) TaxID=1353009 RepID=A0A1Y2J633_TRAC3|nr:hypothetical protein PYCCODRAFT_1421618 [Trametes coccinea BRFM310]
MRRNTQGLEIALRASGTFVDIAIATAMVYHLHKQRRSTSVCPMRRSKKMIHRLIVLTVVTGLWTAIAALIDFVLVAAFPQGLLFCIVELPFSSLYVNSLLANLNARQFLRKTDVELSSIEFYTSRGDTRGPTNSTMLRSMPNGRGAAARGNTAVAIRVDTSHIVDTDYTTQADKAAVPYY